MNKKQYCKPHFNIIEVKMQHCLASSEKMCVSGTTVTSDENVFSRSNGDWDEDE